MTSTPSAVKSAQRPPTSVDARETDRRSWSHRLLFGPPAQPKWVRPTAIALLAATAVLYLWGLAGLGWGNEYYAATAQAGTQSWKALLFGSIDGANAITVDKPPASLWLMGLSGRIFGFSAFSVMLPQALLGVGSVALVYAAVRRCHSPAAGLLAGAALALTPVAALMFRYDNPDALLTFLLVLGAYCVVRAIGSPSTRWWSASTGWLALAGVAIGFGFLTKMMQAFLVLPGLGLAFLIAGAGGVWSRIVKLLAACAALAVASGWYIALVAFWPADSRPYIGGSSSNSLWELAVDYNGLGRLLGGHGNPGATNKPAGASFGAAFGGDTGLTRLFRDLMGTEISWLLPAALIGLLAGLWLTRRAPRTDMARAGFLVWGGWLLGTAAVFSYMTGTIHPYYTVALAPAIAALVGAGAVELWSRRDSLAARATLAAMLAATVVLAYFLLARTPDWLPWLRWAVLAGGLATALAMVFGLGRSARTIALIAAAAVIFGFGGTAAYTIDTVATAHSGGIPSSGPAGDIGLGKGFGQGFDSAALDELIAGSDNTWAAAVVSAGSASTLELHTGKSVMALGGFSGGDNYPSLQQFQQYVAEDQIGYLVMDTRSQGERPQMGSQKRYSDQVVAWVKANFTATQVGSTAVYDLSEPIR